MLKQFNTLEQLMNAFKRPKAAIKHFTKIRWKNGKFCPHCRHDVIYTMKPFNRYRCAECKTNFSITVGTIFEDTKLPLRVWFGAIWLLTNHPKGIASTTLARDLGVSQPTAWFMLHRLRHAARTKSFNAPRSRLRLRGKVEVDETYVGGKSTNRHGRRSGTGGGHKGKTPVVGAVERKGEVVARVLPIASQPELQGSFTTRFHPALSYWQRTPIRLTPPSKAFLNTKLSITIKVSGGRATPTQIQLRVFGHC